MMRQSVRSSRGANSAGRLIVGLALALPALLVSAPPASAVPSPMRYQNFHGDACQAGSPSTSLVNYSNQGVTISSAGLFGSTLTCPVTWSLDSTTAPLLEIYLTISWSGVPTTTLLGPQNFDPGCMLLMNTSSSVMGGLFIVPYDHTINPGTSTPTLVYHWKATDPSTAPVMYQNVIGSLVSCVSVPSGVVLNGYSVTTCIASATSSCSF
jgi:hypothetical protein